MKFASISDEFFNLCEFDRELMNNEDERRPYLIVVRLKFNGTRHDFAIPFRSNIKGNIPKEQYFSLPPTGKTRDTRIHGLHFLKMFPVKDEFLEKYHMSENSFYDIILKRIQKHTKEIVTEAQSYLIRYEQGIRPDYCTDIYGIYQAIYGVAIVPQVAVAREEKIPETE